MVRRIIHTGIFFVLFTGVVCGQSKEPQPYHWNFGISAGDILHTLFNSEESNQSYAAFVLEYTWKRNALQAGFRPGYNMNDTEHEGFSDTEITHQSSLSYHFNFTRILFNDHHWLLQAGLKYEGGTSKDEIIKDSGFDRVTTTRLQWNGGIGPVVDFRFFVHPRFSLGTEASLLYSYYESEVQQLFTNFPDFDTTLDKVTGDKVEVFEPMTIYLRFHF